MGRTKAVLLGLSAFCLVTAAAAQEEPPELRGDAHRCTELFASEPRDDHAENAARAGACLAEACRDPSQGDAIVELQLALRVSGQGRARARIVEGSLGDRARDRCVTRVLGRTPFAARAGRARATVVVRDALILSSPEPAPRREPERRALPASPSREAIGAEMRRVRPLVGACLPEGSPPVAIRMSFSSDGRVRTAEPTGEVSADVARCAGDALKRVVQLPPFTRPSFRIVYPFRREAGDEAVSVESLDTRAAQLPAAMRNDSCRAMILEPPAPTVLGAVHGAADCILESCNPHLEASRVDLDFEVRFHGESTRARLVRGSVGDRATQRCVERALRYAPYPTDAAGHRRVRVELTDRQPRERDPLGDGEL